MTWITLLTLNSAAAITACISAIIGMAGGIILLAIMLLFLPIEQAIPLHAAVQLISNGTRVILFLKHVQWRVWALFSLPALLGILGGRQLFIAMNPEHLQIVVALFILITTYLPKPKSGDAWPLWPFMIAGSIAGAVGMLVGATGPIIAPFFIHAKLLKEKLIATKAVCQATVHVFKLIAFGSIGFSLTEQTSLIASLGLAVIVGTFAGKRLLKQVPERVFVILVKTALTVIGSKLLISALI